MGPDGIVVVAPGLDDPSCCRQAHEPVLVEALVAEPPIEALYVRILHRLSGVDEVQVHAV